MRGTAAKWKMRGEERGWGGGGGGGGVKEEQRWKEGKLDVEREG